MCGSGTLAKEKGTSGGCHGPAVWLLRATLAVLLVGLFFTLSRRFRKRLRARHDAGTVQAVKVDRDARTCGGGCPRSWMVPGPCGVYRWPMVSRRASTRSGLVWHGCREVSGQWWGCMLMFLEEDPDAVDRFAVSVVPQFHEILLLRLHPPDRKPAPPPRSCSPANHQATMSVLHRGIGCWASGTA